MDKIKKCLNCGRDLDEDMILCPYCGSNSLKNVFNYGDSYNDLSPNIQNNQSFNSINNNIQNNQSFNSINNNMQNVQSYNSINNNMQNVQGYNYINNKQNNLNYNSVDNNIQNDSTFNYESNDSDIAQTEYIVDNEKDNLNADIQIYEREVQNKPAVNRTYGISYLKNNFVSRFDKSLKDSKKVMTTIISVAVIFAILLGAIVIGFSNDENGSDKDKKVVTEEKDTKEKIVGSQNDEKNSNTVKNVEFTKGELANNCYTNEWLGIKFTIPEGYEQSSQEKYNSYEDKENICGVCVEKTDGSSIAVVFTKDTELNTTVDTFSKNFGSGLTRTNSSCTLSYDEEVTGGNIKFKASHYSFSTQGYDIPVSYYIAKKENIFITIVEISPGGTFLTNNSFITKLENIM